MHFFYSQLLSGCPFSYMHNTPGSMHTVRHLRQFSGLRLLRCSAASLLLCCSCFLSSFSWALAALCLSLASFLSLAFCLSTSISSLDRRFLAGLGVPPPSGLGGDKVDVFSLFVADGLRFSCLQSGALQSWRFKAGVVSAPLSSSDSDISHVLALRNTDMSSVKG